MGLNVYVYKNIKKNNDDENYDFTAYVIHPSWEYKIKNLENGAKYNGERCNCDISYSYSSHNRFREHLIKMIDRYDLLKEDGTINWSKLDKEVNIPFYDFINFADNEGCLDWETNEKIFNDFKKYEKKVINYAGDNNYFIIKYNDWFDVFENGKDKNAVVVFS